jgi:hypothetical protein
MSVGCVSLHWGFNFVSFPISVGARGIVVVKALCYKPEGHEFEPDEEIFLNLPNPSGFTRPWGLFAL